MNDQNRPAIRTCLLWPTILFVWAMLAACQNEGPAGDAHPEQARLDSIAAWNARGRKADRPKEYREAFLSKAWEAATGIRDDSARLRDFSRIQWSYLDLGDSSRFRHTNRETKVLALKLKDSMRLGFTYWDLGIFYDRNRVKDSAYFHLSRAQKLYEALGDDRRVGILSYALAGVQADIKDYTGGEINTVKAIEHLKPLDEFLLLYRCYNLMGILAKDLKEYERALEYYDIANTYLDKADARERLAHEIDNNIGVTYQEMGEHQKAATYYRKVLAQDSLLLKNPGSFARTMNNLANCLQYVEPDADIEGLFLRSLEIRDSIGDMADLAGGNYSLAKYYLEQKDTANALVTVWKAKDYAVKSTNNERLLESLELLAQLDIENAADHSRQYVRLNDSLQQEERKIRNKFARIQFETEEVEAENELLARQKQLWTGIAFTLLLLGISILVIIGQRTRNERLRFDQAQQISNEKIFNLMLSEKQQFEEGKKLEQKRISEELHDGVLGKMLGARMVLTGLNKRTGKMAVTERGKAIAALQEVESEVRSLSHELSNSAYRQIDNFIRSIQDLLKNIGNAAQIKHTFNYNKEVLWDDLHGDIKINVYRMVQESVQNAVKHSKCEHLEVDFSTADRQIQVLVKDDGIGFDFKKRKRGIGIRNIRSRIKKIHGTWRIESAPGKGTTVRLSIPLVYFSNNPPVIDESGPVEKA